MLRFISGRSACNLCRLDLDATDDYIAVSPLEAHNITDAGFYHRLCYESAPNRDELTSLWQHAIRNFIAQRTDSWTILHGTDEFLATIASPDTALNLYCLQRRAEMRFLQPELWAEFVSLLGCTPLAQGLQFRNVSEVASEFSNYRVSFSTKKPSVTLQWTCRVHKEVDFIRSAFKDYVSEHGPQEGYVDFEHLCEQRGLKPIFVDGNLVYCKGIITEIKEVNDVVVISLDAMQRKSVTLDQSEFLRFREFIFEADSSLRGHDV